MPKHKLRTSEEVAEGMDGASLLGVVALEETVSVEANSKEVGVDKAGEDSLLIVGLGTLLALDVEVAVRLLHRIKMFGSRAGV